MRTVDVKPHSLFPAEVSHLLQRIERTRGGGAGASHDGNHPFPFLNGSPVKVGESGNIGSKVAVRGNRDHGLRTQAEDPGRTRQGVMRLV